MSPVLSWDREEKQPRKSTHEGVTVISYKLFNGSNFSALKFIIAGITIQLLFVLWILRNVRGACSVHSHDLNTLPAGVMIKIVRPQAKLVYDCHEYNRGAYALMFGPSVGNLVGVVEKQLSRKADVIITVCEPIAQYLRQLSGRPVVVLYNTIELSDAPPGEKSHYREKLGLHDFVIAFVGVPRPDYALEELIEAARAHSLRSDKKVSLVFVGNGPDIPHLQEISKDLDFVSFKYYLPLRLALEYVKASDLVYAVLRDTTDNQRIALPVKTFEAMACGVPTLLSHDTYSWTFVKHLGIGMAVNPPTAHEVELAIGFALSDPLTLEEMSKRAREAFFSQFNWNSMAQRLVDVYADFSSARRS